MSRYKAVDIVAPNTEVLSPHTMHVTFNRAARTVGGLDSLVNTEKGAVVCASNSATDFWFRCRSLDAAAEILEKYHNGDFLSLKWYREKS